MDESRFAAALERAQQLMNDSTFNSLVEKKSGNVSFSPNDDIIKENVKGSSHDNFMSEIAAIKETGINNILETVKNRQIGDNALSTTPNVIERLVSKNTINPKTVTENILPNNYIANSAIDYSIIKAIVNECISSQLSNIKETLINESTLRGFTIKEGNKVQFIAKNGNLYEGELKLKKIKNK